MFPFVYYFISFFSGAIISSIFLWFSSGFTIYSWFDIVNASAVFFPKYHLLYELRFRKLFSQCQVLYAIVIFCFLANDENRYPSTYSLVLDSTEYGVIFLMLISNVKLAFHSISHGLPFWSVNVIIYLFHQTPCYNFFKTLNYLVQRLTNEHNIYFE